MSYYHAKQLFYATSSLIITLGLFLILPFGFGQMQEFKTEVNDQFATALIQTFGDKPFIVDDLAFVWDVSAAFYEQSADSALALLEPGSSEDDMVRVVRDVYTTFTTIASEFEQARIERVAGEHTEEQTILNEEYGEGFMQEESLMNIVPENLLSSRAERGDLVQEQIASPPFADRNDGVGQVEGDYIIAGEPLNTDNPWVTLQDNLTGQLYCVAIYNNEVNKYLGPCKYDSPR